MHRRPAAIDLILHCPFCQGLLANDGSLVGQLAYCPQCLNQFQMPGAPALPVAKPASPESLARTVPAVIRNPLTSLPPQRYVQVKERVPLALAAPNSAPEPVPAQRAGDPPPPPAPDSSQRAGWTPTLPDVERIPWSELERQPPGSRPRDRAAVAESLVPAPPAAPSSVPAAPPEAAECRPMSPHEAPRAAETPVPAPTENDPLAILPPPAASGVPPAIATGQPVVECEKDCPAFFADVMDSFPAFRDVDEFPRVAVDSPEPISGPPPEVAEGEGESEGVTAAWERNVPAIVTSAVTHAVLLIALAMWIISRESPPVLDLLADWSPVRHTEFETARFEVKLDAPQAVDPSTLPESSPVEPAPLQAPAEGLEVQEPQAVADVREATPAKAPGGKPLKSSPFDGRGEGRRQKLVLDGGSPESESAVALGLAWLKEHQYPDGGWRFDHTACPSCKGKCDDPGGHNSTTGATALALLPFLGAGQTHQQGKYQEVVRRGLYYLMKKMEGRGDEAGDFRGEDGDMYCHGLAATALCEAYGMSRDKMLLVPAQKSIDFIAHAQDSRGGGWRYQPLQRGDTSVVGWQIMAMKSGHLAYLKVPKATVTRASSYLDSVSSESGALYGYTNPGRGTSATTAIGLLCRMHLGWSKEHPGIVRGVQYLAEEGPSRNNIYFNYYATQALHHFGGPQWKRWNEVMREQLVNTQAKNGHEAGSWGGRDNHQDEGGRIFTTSLSIMTLEVYYRHMPLYREDAVKNEFAP